MNGDRLRILLPLLILVALGITPQATRITSSLAAAELGQKYGSPGSVGDHLSVVLAFEPWRIDLFEKLGSARYEANQYEAAVYAFGQAEKYGILSTDGQILYAKALEQQGDPAAYQKYRRLLSQGIHREDIFDKVYLYQMQTGDLEGAADTLLDWIAFQPDKADLYYTLGLVFGLIRPAQARVYLEQAAAIDPNYNHQVLRLSKALYEIAFVDDPAYRKLVMGRAFASVQRWDLAVLAFREAVQLNPSYAEAWAFLAEAEQQNGQDGFQSLQTALTLNPESIPVKSLAAIYWRRQGNVEKALELLFEIQEAEPQQAAWLLEIGNMIAESGDLPRALGYYQKAAEMDPLDPLYWRSLAMFCGQYNIEFMTIGFPAARKALLLSPQDPLVLDTMGWLLFLRGDDYSAERFLLKAVKLDEANPLIQYHLSQLYLKRQDYQKAYPYLDRTAAMSEPGSNLRKMADRLLKKYYSNENR